MCSSPGKCARRRLSYWRRARAAIGVAATTTGRVLLRRSLSSPLASRPPPLLASPLLVRHLKTLRSPRREPRSGAGISFPSTLTSAEYACPISFSCSGGGLCTSCRPSGIRGPSSRTVFCTQTCRIDLDCRNRCIPDCCSRTSSSRRSFPRPGPRRSRSSSAATLRTFPRQ